jgi:hypothetical protein
MTTRTAVLAVLAAVVLGGGATTAANGAAGDVTVTLDRPSVSTSLGQSFGFASTVRNAGDGQLTGLIAHLNVLSVDPDVYVDPEDWSSRRTQFLAPLAPGASVDLPWRVQAVNSGELVVYVAVTAEDGADPVVASGPLRLTVTEQRTVNAGGVLPLAVAMPAAVLVLMGAAARRRRRRR